MASGDKRLAADYLNIKNENGKLVDLNGNALGGSIPAPKLTVPGSDENPTSGTILNENAEKTFSVNDFIDTMVVNVTADIGTISEASGGSFKYTAPDVTDDADIADVIRVRYSLGPIVSETQNINVTVKYLPAVADEAIINNDFATNAEVSSEYNYAEEFK